MYNYIISFRIHQDSDGENDYQERYDALELYIADRTKILSVWDCTTSFFIVKSIKTIQALSSDIGDCLKHPHDKFLVYRIETKETLYKGSSDELQLLRSFLPTTGSFP